MRKAKLTDKINSLTSLEEIEGYLEGIELNPREVFPIEVTLMERRIDFLDACGARGNTSGVASRPSLEPRYLKARLVALAGRNQGVAK